ncbi:MAG: DUF3267 domain-containing protein [Bacteroidales bacterium]|nr:DUF3267 domain-containing protein [Bacteroidales bacterium]
MSITPSDIISNSRYRLIKRINYSDIADFVFSCLKPSNPVIALLLSFTLISLGLAISVRIDIWQLRSAGSLILYTLTGLVVFPLLLIPVHEGLHVIIFLAFGGRDIRIGADIRNFIFYVTAHRHVVSTLAFIIIAMFPFVVITLATLIGMVWLPPVWKWSLSLSLLAHTTMCAGDFAMAAFYFENRDKRILTWDDADEKIAYFYEDTGV